MCVCTQESLPPESFEKLSRLLACMIENSEDIFEVGVVDPIAVD